MVPRMFIGVMIVSKKYRGKFPNQHGRKSKKTEKDKKIKVARKLFFFFARKLLVFLLRE